MVSFRLLRSDFGGFDSVSAWEHFVSGDTNTVTVGKCQTIKL